MAPHTRSSNKNKAAAAASTTNAPTTGAHLTNNQPKGILRRTTTTTTTTSRPAPAQAKEELAAKELDALTGLQMLASGADAHAPRQQELARLETEDPVAHHYAQTVEERAPYALQAAAVLVGMSGGDVSAVAAELAEKKREREEKEEAKRAAGAVVMGAFRVGGLSARFPHSEQHANG